MRILRSVFSKLPLKVTAPILLTVPVLVVVVALSTVAFVQGRDTADDLADQNMRQIHRRIEEHLSRLMDLPPAINELNKHMLDKGQLLLTDVDRNRVPVFETLNIFQAVSSIVIGKATGQTMWVIRYPGETTYEYAIKRAPDAAMTEFPLGDKGQIIGKRLSQYKFHPTLRPWYRAAIAADGPTWGGVYIWVRNGKGETLGIPYVEPYRDSDGNTLGVVNCELTLSDISAYLHRLEVGKTGKAFIVEPDGNLVATSVGIECMTESLERLPASEAPDTWIAHAAKELLKRFGSLDRIVDPRQITIVVENEPMRLVVSPYANRRNLNWLIVTLVPEVDFMAGVQAGRRRSVAIGLAAVVVTLLLGIVMAMLAVRPFLALVAELHRVGEGDLEHEIHLEHTPEFRQLSAEINAMTAGLRDRMQLRQSLAVAMEVQQNLLPATTPKVEGLDIAGHSTYCDETGGDYYDYLDVTGLSENTVAIAVGDVMGHGVAAAMLMATARGILISRCGETGSLAELLTHMNHHLVRDVGESSGRFMTMLLMTIDATRCEMRWASAGHDMPIIYDPNDDRFIEIDAAGVPLGILEDQVYDETTLPDLRAGQIFFAATDGLWETHNEAGEMYGKERLCEVMRRAAALSADEISRAVREDLARFQGESRQDDDVTFVIVKVL